MCRRDKFSSLSILIPTVTCSFFVISAKVVNPLDINCLPQCPNLNELGFVTAYGLIHRKHDEQQGRAHLISLFVTRLS